MTESVRIQVEPILAVELVHEFDQPDQIYRSLGARPVTRNGNFTATLDPTRIWIEVQGHQGTLRIDASLLAEFSEISLGWLPQSAIVMETAFGVPFRSDSPSETVLATGELADVDGDGNGDVIATKSDGSMWLYHGSGSLAYPFSSGVRIGASGWNGFDRLI